MVKLSNNCGEEGKAGKGEFPGAGNGLPFAAVSRLPSRAAMGRGGRRGSGEKDSEGLGEGEGKRRGQRPSKVGPGGSKGKEQPSFSAVLGKAER